MGAQISCPQGFDPGALGSCRMRCPDDFSYDQVSGEDVCRSKADPSMVIPLFKISMFGDQTQSIVAEQNRVNQKAAEIRAKAKTRQSLLEAKNQSGDLVKKYDSIQSKYADFTSVGEALANTNKELKVKRPPTAPVDDLSRERALILNGPTINILMIQIALFLAILSLLSFMVMSREMAQGMTFLLLTTGVAIGFFLRK